MPERLSILVIDDETGVPDSPHQRAFMRAHGGATIDFRFSAARRASRHSVAAAMDALATEPLPALVLLDLCFGPEGDRLGLAILRELRSRHPAIPVLMLSNVGRDVTVLGQCLEEGAIGFVEKAATPRDLRDSVERALAMDKSHSLVGKSPALRELRRQAARLSPYDQIPVLITGERGTGKERVARHIHHNGPRSAKAFVAVNCAAIPETLIEAEFFGAEKGAYTGATAQRTGFIERAHGGVLFLDEVGDMPLTTQAKLLRVLQDGTYRRIGSSEVELEADFQLICATNVDPAELLTKKRLREDFYDRIAAVSVRTPPLRDCRADIPELAAHFLRQLGLADKKTLTAEVIRIFREFEWPGNVRQLQRAIQEAVVRSEDVTEIEPRHLPDFRRPQPVRSQPHATTSTGPIGLPESPADWPETRLVAEIELALAAKQRIQAYKGKQWKAEFMRLMYPHCKAANAKGFDDLIKRLTQGPWGEPTAGKDGSLEKLIQLLLS